jgi:2'-5' RNA ligase
VNDERARLFVALELPDRVRGELVAWRGGPLGGVSGLRMVSSEALHVTLCFLGWRGVDEVGDIAAACAAVVGRATRGISLGSGLWLPERARPRVVAVRIEDPAGAVAALQSALSAALARGGWYAPEARPYLPHVTVARVSKGARIRGDELPPPGTIEFVGREVTLYRSRLAPSGARYEALETVSLAA